MVWVIASIVARDMSASASAAASSQEAAAALPAISIAARLARALAVWSIAVVAALSSALWVTASHEVNELLDDALVSAAELMALLVDAGPDTLDRASNPGTHPDSLRFAWQIVAVDGSLLYHSQQAPKGGWTNLRGDGFENQAGWRLYSRALSEQRRLTVGQTRDERADARVEVIAAAASAALLAAVLGHLWLRSRVRDELAPLQELSRRIRQLNLDSSTQASYLGRANRQELASVHEAVETLSARLANRIAKERAFSAHAAHALRTPLAGIDVQLALSMKDGPESTRDRLQRIREATQRLQHVVTALLGLFRSQAPARHVELKLDALVRSLPTPTLRVIVAPDLRLRADPDLLAAALVNLLDNAQRHGASQVWIEPWPAGGLLIRDDGPGVSAPRRQVLRNAVESEADAAAIGLGLMLADSVARAHGGRLILPDIARGFAVALEFGDSNLSES